MINRKDIRSKALALLIPHLSAAQEVLKHKPSKIEGQTPIVYLTSSGSNRPPLTSRGLKSQVMLNIHILVLQSKEDENYTNENSEDLLDDLEFGVALFVETSQRAEGSWISIDYDGKTNADNVIIEEGHVYTHEIIRLIFTC